MGIIHYCTCIIKEQNLDQFLRINNPEDRLSYFLSYFYYADSRINIHQVINLKMIVFVLLEQFGIRLFFYFTSVIDVSHSPRDNKIRIISIYAQFTVLVC